MSDLHRPYPVVTLSTNSVGRRPAAPGPIGTGHCCLAPERHHHDDRRGHSQCGEPYVSQDSKRPLAGRPPRFFGTLTA